MIGALTKSIGELTSQDVEELISLGVQEGETVEFKESFSSNDHKKAVLKEVVAFANGYGGRIFIGIAERSGNPSVAAEVKPLPDCANLADQMGRACADLVDPPVLRLDVGGVTTKPDGSGVIVLDVPRSIRAPHMSKRDHCAYRRRGSESVPMDMRDIQDMTLRSASRFSVIEAQFDKRRQDFEVIAREFAAANDQGYCFRLSFVPLDEIDLGRVHMHGHLVLTHRQFSGRVIGDNTQDFGTPATFEPFVVRPVVRGSKSNIDLREHGYFLETTLWSDGRLEIAHGDTLIDSRDKLNLTPETLVGCFANGLRIVGHVRRRAATPSLSYALETQLRVFGKPVILHFFNDRGYLSNGVHLRIGDHTFPRYEIGPKNEFDDRVTEFVMDWFNDAGIDWQGKVAVNFRLD